jgi:hypothetical protein
MEQLTKAYPNARTEIINRCLDLIDDITSIEPIILGYRDYIEFVVFRKEEGKEVEKIIKVSRKHLGA